MGHKKAYTVSELSRKPTLFQTAKPFDITRDGQVIATVVGPNNADWHKCENCGINTQNMIEFEDEQFKWVKLVLCDRCADELL